MSTAEILLSFKFFDTEAGYDFVTKKPPALDGHDVAVPWYDRVTDLKKRHNALKVEILCVKAGGLLESSGVFWNPSRQGTWHTVGFTGYRST